MTGPEENEKGKRSSKVRRKRKKKKRITKETVSPHSYIVAILRGERRLYRKDILAFIGAHCLSSCMCQEVSVETGRTAAEQSIQEDSVGITLSRLLGPSGPFLGLGSFNPDAFINTRQQRDGKRLSAAYSYWPR